MPSKRRVLDQLKRDELLAAVERFELPVADRRRRDLLMEALASSRKATLTEVLGDLKRARLKQLCRGLGLDDGGRAKAPIIERLAGKGSPAPEPARAASPAAKAALADTAAAVPLGENKIESRLWQAADELRANSRLKSSEYSVPVLGLIFLRYADHKFAAAEAELAGKSTGRRRIGPADYQARGVLYLRAEARFSNLLRLPEGAKVGQAIGDAMLAIEAENRDLKGVLPKSYNRLENASLAELLKLMNSIPMDVEGDAFGKIYEYFLGKFAMSEGQKGGEFFTPTSIVKLIVGIMEPFHGRIFDPACGSGGMFVQSARFVAEHQASPGDEISIHGQERVAETVRLAKMNLAVHGLGGDVRQGNSYYDDLHASTAGGGKFDFVMANPPFNVNRVVPGERSVYCGEN